MNSCQIKKKIHVHIECVRACSCVNYSFLCDLQNVKLSAGHHQRSALRLTTSENTPRMRFNDTYTLKLVSSESQIQ